MEQAIKTQSFPHPAILDLALPLATLICLKYIFLQFEATWTFAGPISLIASLAVAHWRLKRNNESWRDLGFTHTASKLNLILWSIGALVITIVAGNMISVLGESFFSNANIAEEQTNTVIQNRFANVPGNFPVYLYWIAISWIIGAFTEELLFRGFMITRVQKIFSKSKLAIIYAIIFQAVIFGQQHIYYQGMIGFFETGLIGIVAGIIYVYSKYRLWPLIISHGLANTLGMTMIYLS